MRIAICQPLVPKYRVPVFDLLGAQPGIELTVYAGTSSGSLDAAAPSDHFTVVQSPLVRHSFGITYQIVQAAQVEAVDKSRHDLLILPWDAHYRSGFRAIDQARRVGLPVVVWGHGYSKRRGRPWATVLRNRMGRRADAVMLYTHTVADRLVQRYGFDAQRVFVAQNALDQRPIQAARAHWLARPEALAAFRREHQLNPEHTVIFVSRLEPDNHCEVLIHALADVRAAVPDARLVLVGKGPTQEALATLAKALEQSDHVTFAGAIYDEDELAPWMLSSALFCYPSNIGLSILHAFGYGLPVVTGDNLATHNPEIEALQPGVNGLLCRDLDPGAMARRWQELFADPALRQRCGAAGRQLVLRKYTVPNMVQGFLDATRLVDQVERRVVVPSSYTQLATETAAL